MSVKASTADFRGVTYVGADRGIACELLGLDDPLGIRFELVVLIQYDCDDPLLYKRYLTAAHLAILEVLDERKIKFKSTCAYKE